MIKKKIVSLKILIECHEKSSEKPTSAVPERKGFTFTIKSTAANCSNKTVILAKLFLH